MVRTALISGAGIAGSTLAWQLAARGIDVTIVEKSQGQRSSGNPIDVHGDALGVVERIGVADRIRAAATTVRRLVAVDARGRQVAAIPATMVWNDTDSVEIPRADLSRILLEAAAGRSRVVFDDSIADLNETPHGVDVVLSSGEHATYDIIVGADGQHSRVRSLAFGSEALFAEPTDMLVATVVAPDAVVDGRDLTMLNIPGRSLTVHPSTGTPLAAFIFHSAFAEHFDSRYPDAQRSLVADAYAGVGWRVPEFLERFMAADDVYFDVVTRIRLDSWHTSRVVLLGDAASSVSLFGDGSSLAILGASRLAAALAAHPDDPKVAFAEYERLHRMSVMPKQNGMTAAAAQLVPRTAYGLAVRNAVLRGMQTYAALRRYGVDEGRRNSRANRAIRPQ